jgi:mono/diheme cytochrome c family protein
LRTERNARLRRSLGLLALAPIAAMAVVAGGCRQNMHNQAKAQPFEESDFFSDHVASRPLPAHTVSRGDLRAVPAHYSGIGPDLQLLAAPPFPVTSQVLRRGEQRFNIFCSPCHGRLGDGKGMIVQRGYKQPPSFHEARLRASRVGYFFNVMTEGFGVMPSYASQIPVADRWAIASYVRALQYSQGARLSDLSEAERQRVRVEERRP